MFSGFSGFREKHLLLLRHLSSAKARFLQYLSPMLQLELLHSYCIVRFKQSSPQPSSGEQTQVEAGSFACVFFQVAAASPIKRSVVVLATQKFSVAIRHAALIHLLLLSRCQSLGAWSL